jgi:cell fate (sporulation/competence/biofilm development) regulator YlbF (YheA/YmcA/DUF963 family)
MNDRPTPETDQFKVKFKTVCGEKYWVPLELSERLELELNEAWKELEEYRSIAESIGAVKAVSEKEKAIRERDEARDIGEKLSKQGLDMMDENRSLKRERDEAIELLKYSSKYSTTKSQQDTYKFLRKIGKLEDTK